MFKQQILDNQNFIKETKIIPRDYQFYQDLLNLKKIVSFVGPRRVGKTFLMFDFLKRLISNNQIQLQQIVFIDFSLYAEESIDPKVILSDFFELFPQKTPFFVFDELQEIKNFKNFTLYLFNQGYRIFLSGSNSKLLSQELTTHFRGRVFEYKVLPLTFKEILRFKGLENKKKLSTKEKGIYKNILNEILEFGNFPEIVISENNFFKINNLKTYFDILIYKDLLERYNIDNEHSLKYLLKAITVGFTKNINIHKIYNELKSQNIKIGKSTLYEYYSYIKNIFYFFELQNYYNPKGAKKAYLYNFGFNKIITNSINFGQSFENMVFIELFKKYENIYFKTNGAEIDFFVEEINKNIGVCYNLTEQNLNRETKSLSGDGQENIIVYLSKENNIDLEKEKGVKFFDFFEFINWLEEKFDGKST